MTYTNFPNGVSVWAPSGPGVPLMPNPQASYFGNIWFVDTVNGSDGYDGKSPQSAFQTMGRAFWSDYTENGYSSVRPNLNRNDTIYFVGKVREQLLAPLLGVDGTALTGVQIVGMAQGNTRDDDGAKWYTPASPVAGRALIEIRQQGWVFQNLLMTPDITSGMCIKAHRAESATYPDSSHFVCRGVRFVGTTVTTTYGIYDLGGNHHYIVDGCEFQGLGTGIYYDPTDDIAPPLRNTVMNCTFRQNTRDIYISSSYGLFQGNRHFSAAATTKIDTAVPAGGAGFNIITGCVFPNVAADIDPSDGYTGAATDFWCNNYASDAVIYGSPPS